VTVTRVGAVGLGLLGSALTGTLLARGVAAQGFDLDPARVREHVERGGIAAGSVAEAVRGVDRVLLALPTSEIAQAVCLGPDGIADAAAAGTVVMDATTARPDDSEAIAAALGERGVAYLDTCVSGSSAMAWERDILLLVGGPADALAQALPVLEPLGRAVLHVGGPGAGARMKLIVNLVLGAHRVVLAEALVLGERSGLDPGVVLDALTQSAAYSKAMDGWGARMVAGDHERPMSRVRQHAKDVDLILAQGRDARAPLWMASTVSQVLQLTKAMGLADADNSAVIAAYRHLAAADPPPSP